MIKKNETQQSTVLGCMHSSSFSMQKVLLIAFTAGLLLFVCACGEKQDPVSDELEYVDGGVTYTEDIQQILDINCIGCHATYRTGAERNGAPIGVDFNNHDVASESAEGANTRIQSGNMPVGGTLTDEEKSLFQEWIDDGVPE